MDPAVAESNATLRDGRVVHIRAMRTQDEAELLQTFDRMSDDARYMRFMRVVHEPNLERLRKSLGSLPESGIGLVATVPAADGVDIVGSAVAMITSETGHCEFAINVDSKFGGTGLATELMKRLIDAARKRGLQVMEGFVLTENQSMLRLARRLGFSIGPDPDDSSIRICRLQLGSS